MKIAKDYTEAETDAMRYGTEAHLAAEEFIRDGKPVPVKFAYMKDVLEALNRRRGNKITEIKMGLTQELEPCGFMSKDVWWRGIADLVITDGSTAWIVDYKTGKSAKYADKGQLELMALATFKYFPNIKNINAALIFTKAKKFVKHKYTDDMIDSLWDKWLSKFRRMEVAYETDTWNAHPSGLCKRHCAVIECVYNGSN
jgi:CRISPR/Cas system-associated exonuclease Cas4 (RecB family)